MDTFAVRLRADRERAGLTVRQLAVLSQISFSYITKIETGRSGKGVSPDIVTALAGALGCDELEYLYLSDVVPGPLNLLLTDKRSRTFVQELLAKCPTSDDWDLLEAALAESTKRHPDLKRKSRGKSAA
jgi:transcriptional regulator with XRE-family HTH domain